MRIYFLTRQPDVCQLLADCLAGPNVEIKIYPLLTSLFQTIFEFGVEPDILFLDYVYYASSTFNPYSLLLKQGKMFPIVFYNHPFPLSYNRKTFWLNELAKTEYFSDLSKIEPLLEKMQQALADPAIYPYVTCIQEPKEYISDDLRYIEPIKDNEVDYYVAHFSNVITDFLVPGSKRKRMHENSIKEALAPEFIKNFLSRTHMSPKLITLFNKFYTNCEKHLSVAELCACMAENGKPATPNGLRLAIHRLRELLSNEPDVKLDIISFNKGYMLTSVDSLPVKATT
ncbi:MAG: hypothetical protein KBS84_03105 [Treponema sp.]|nr:hypothetical protein [Candidatus Treponema scatequi]